MRLDLLEEHVDEACFLFGQRQNALRSLVLTQGYLEGVDERLAAHLDALVVAGDAGWDHCRPLLDGLDAEAGFVSAMVALHGDEARAREVERALSEADSLRPGPAWALCLAEGEAVDALSRRLLDSPNTPARAAGLQALCFRRCDPGPALEGALAAEAPELRRAALEGVRCLRARPHTSRVEALASSPDGACREAALDALLVLEPQLARRIAIAELQAGGLAGPAAARVLGLAGQESDVTILASAARAQEPVLARAALLALGSLGYAAAVPVLLAALEDAPTVRRSGCALLRLLGPGAVWEPAAGAVGPEETPPEVDDDLPLWSAPPLRAWWEAHRAGLRGGERHRAGAVFRAGPPRAASGIALRHDEAVEEAIAAPEQPLRETRAWAAPPAIGTPSLPVGGRGRA